VLEQSNHNNTSNTDTVAHIFVKLGIVIKSIKIIRLGRPNDKSHPLKIELQTASDVFEILDLSCLL